MARLPRFQELEVPDPELWDAPGRMSLDEVCDHTGDVRTRKPLRHVEGLEEDDQ